MGLLMLNIPPMDELIDLKLDELHKASPNAKD
jgi:hypothetical protein